MSLLVLYVLLLMLSPTEIKDHRQAHKGAKCEPGQRMADEKSVTNF
jgi:hypothetical protein